mgnify:CR=1 FL=1|tara:strand:+ start:351256 stop:352365 length:1110 start_codon:yes stop_codon:yes gene_type:complete
MFRVAIQRIGAVLLAVLALNAGAASLVIADPEPTPTPVADAGPVLPETPASDPLPTAPAFDAQLVSVLPSSTGALTLVGRSGQQYEPKGDLTWQRVGAGGVSVSVMRMFRGGNGKLFAVGDRAPLFSKTGGSKIDGSKTDALWAGYSLARKGPAAASTGSAPVIALRRQLYELGANGWRALATTPAIVAHLWASSRSRIFFSDTDGQLWSGRGGGWQRISITLGPKERVTQIHGVPGKLAVALTSQGRLFSLESRTAKLVSAGSLGSELKVQALGVVKGTLLAAAVHPSKTVLLEVGAKSMTEVGELWPIRADDKVTIIAAHPKGLLIATSQGQMRLQLANGSWKNAAIKATPPGAAPRFPNSGPAQAR